MAFFQAPRSGYAVAALGTAAAFFVHQSLLNGIGPYPLLLLFIAPVIGAAWLGGLRPGILATLLAVAAATLTALLSGELALDDTPSQIRVAMFLVTGFTFSFLFEALHGYRNREREMRLNTELLASQLQAVLDSVPHQIFAIDEHCRYTYISEGVLETSARPREQVLGRTIWEVFPETRDTVFEQKVRHAVATRAPVSFDFHYQKMDRWLEVHVRPSRVGSVLVVADITRRKRTEQALAREQELLQTIIDTIPVMITLYEPESRSFRINKAFERLTGWTQADAAQGTLAERCYPDAGYRARVARGFEDSRPGWSEVRLRTRKGDDVDTSWTVLRLSDDRRIGIGLDLTELRSADIAQARLAAIVESCDDAVIGKTADGIITSWNAAARRLLGYEAEEAIGQSIMLIVPPERQAEEVALLERLGRGEKIEPFDTVRVGRNGHRVEVSLSVSPLRDRSGKLIGASTLARDVTPRKRSELALQRSEAMLRDFFDNAAIGLHWLGADGIIQRANRADLEMLGYTEAEYVGHHISEFHVEKLAAGEFLRRMLAGQMIQEYEARLRCKDGSIKHVLVSCNVLREDGAFVHARCFTRDITDRTRAEQRLQSMLRLSERLNATLEVDALLDVLVREALLLVGADSGCAGLGSPQAMSCSRYLHVGETIPLDQRWAPGEGIPGWVLLHRQPYLTNDAERDLQITPELRRRFEVRNAIALPIASADGKVLGFFELHNKPGGFDATDRDLLASVARAAAIAMQNALTHRKVVGAEEALREADRRKDEFLATLAHELRNPLAPIRNAVELFRMKRGLDADLLWGHEVIQRQVEQLARLVDDLLDMSRVTRGLIELRRNPTPIRTIVDSAVETSRPLIEANGHHIDIELDDDQLQVLGDLTRLAQVVSNLLNNAAKYTPPGGRIRVSARRSGQQLELRVADNGIGIPPAMLSRIFDMFAQVDRSLERTTGGLGIGLSLVKRLVELHGGAVEARSAGPGKGSEFVVTLPLVTDATAGAAAPAPAPIFLGERTPQTRRVLVVDDNRDSANSLAMLLRVLGHEVDIAHDGLEAVKMANALKPNVVLLDIGLPKLNGYDVARRMRQMPWAREALLVAVTGWGQDEDRRRSRESGFDGHLVKPVELAALQNLLAAPELADTGGKTARVTH